jgi:hypothetical protein
VTDEETILAMLERARIGQKRTGPAVNCPEGTRSIITVEGGYTGFFTEFWFDAEGRLIGMGAYE